jgi:hypothetical protein
VSCPVFSDCHACGTEDFGDRRVLFQLVFKRVNLLGRPVGFDTDIKDHIVKWQFNFYWKRSHQPIEIMLHFDVHLIMVYTHLLSNPFGNHFGPTDES